MSTVAVDDRQSRSDTGSWRADSVCRKHPTEWWFAGGHRETMLAKGICAGCNVRAQCLEFALGRPELLGVWAATTPSERAAMRRAPAGSGAEPGARVEPDVQVGHDPHRCDLDLAREARRESEPAPGLEIDAEFALEQACAAEPVVGVADRHELLTPAEAARLLGVTPNTVTRWSRAGKVSAIQTMGGHRRFRRSEVERVLREANLPAPIST